MQSLRTQLDRALNVQIEKAVSDHQNTANVTNDDSAVEQLTEELRQSNALIMELKHAKQELQHKLLNQQSSVVVHEDVDTAQLDQLKAQVKSLQEILRSKDDEMVICKKNVVLGQEKAEAAAKQCSQV
jgi:predicted RNase H-like nuclease (RuvC/YqgF family)